MRISLKGRKLSLETRRKMSLASAGRRHSVETLRMMSIIHTGKKHTQAARLKMSLVQKERAGTEEYHRKNAFALMKAREANIGRPCSAETRAKIGAANKGKRRTEEQRRWNSEVHKGQVCSEETRIKRSIALKGRVRTEEQRRWMSESQKGNKHALGYVCSEETKRKIGLANTGHVHSAEARSKMSKALKGRIQPKSFCENLRKRGKELAADRIPLMVAAFKKKRDSWSVEERAAFGAKVSKANKGRPGRPQPPEVRAKISATLKANTARHAVVAAGLARRYSSGVPTKPERATAVALDELGYKYLREKPLGVFIVDFLLPDFHIVIEVDGEYWHSLERMKAKDKRKDHWLNVHGYRVIRIGERDANSRAKEVLKAQLPPLVQPKTTPGTETKA